MLISILLPLLWCSISVSTACLPPCSICGVGSFCTKCESSYILYIGSCLECPATCNSCNGYNCTSCTSDGYGGHCQYPCPINCLNDCHIDTGYCTKCKQGLYGTACTKNCSLCKDGDCDLRACRYGCKSGYYELGNDCNECPSNCKSCNSSTKCTVCEEGFYLKEYYFDNNLKKTYCPKCSENEPMCQSGCALKNCNKCQSQGNSQICTECKGDYFTTTCDVECPPSCSQVTGKQTCGIHDGHCLNECNYRTWGDFCNISCPDGCADNSMSGVCERKDGKCMNGCKAGFTGYKCDKIRSTTTSTEHRGSLESETSENLQKTSFVTETSLNPCHRCMRSQDQGSGGNNSNFVIGYMSGIGTIIFLDVIALAIYCLRRRYMSNTSKSDKDSGNFAEMSTYCNEGSSRETDAETRVNEGNNYETLRSSRNTDKVYTDLERPVVQPSISYYNL